MRSINLLPAASDNMGSLQHIQFVAVEQIEEFRYYHPMDMLLVQQIVLFEDFEWLDAFGTVEEYSFSCEQKTNSQGDYYDVNVSMYVPKMNLYDERLLEEMKAHRFVIRAKDNNDYQRICGTTEEPLQFTTKAASGTTISNRNGTIIKWYGTVRHRPPYYNEEMVLGGKNKAQATCTIEHSSTDPVNNNYLIIALPTTKKRIAHSITFFFKTTPTLSNHIQITTGATGNGANTNDVIRAYLAANEPDLLLYDNSVPPFSNPAVQDFICVEGGEYDGVVGNDIIISTSNEAIFTTALSINFSNGHD